MPLRNVLAAISDQSWIAHSKDVCNRVHESLFIVLILWQEIFEPFTYIATQPGKGVRGDLLQALNLWMNVPEDKLAIISKIVHTLHNASLMYAGVFPLIPAAPKLWPGWMILRIIPN